MTKAPKNSLILALSMGLLFASSGVDARIFKKNNSSGGGGGGGNVFNKIGNGIKNTVNNVGNGVKNVANTVGGGVKQGAGFVGGGIGRIKDRFGRNQPGQEEEAPEEFYEEEPAMDEEVAMDDEPAMDEDQMMDEESGAEAYEQQQIVPKKRKFGLFGRLRERAEMRRSQLAAQKAAKLAIVAKRRQDREATQNATIRNFSGINNIHGAMAKANFQRQMNSMSNVPVQYQRPENRVVGQGGVFGRNIGKVSYYEAPSESEVKTGRVSISGAGFMKRGSRSIQRAQVAAETSGRVANNSLISNMNSRPAATSMFQQKPVLKPMPIVRGRPLLRPGLRPVNMLEDREQLSNIKLDKELALNNNFSKISSKLNAVKASALIREPASDEMSSAHVKFARPQKQMYPVKSFARPNQSAGANFSE
jgi:hypothetical protein